MKTLYESILDDEDELIADTKKSVNDPLKLICNILNNGASEKEISDCIESGVLDDFFKDILLIDRKKDIAGLSLYRQSNPNFPDEITFYWNKCKDMNKPLVYMSFMPKAVRIEYVTKREINSELSNPKISQYLNKEIVNSKFYKYHSKIAHNFKKIGGDDRIAPIKMGCKCFIKKY